MMYLSELGKGKKDFRFVVFADTHVGVDEKLKHIKLACKKTKKALETIKKISPYPLFILTLGDVVNDERILNFKKYVSMMGRLNFLNLLVAGNHDWKSSPKNFLWAQKKLNGLDRLNYSFNVGCWHMVCLSLPEGWNTWLREEKFIFFEWLEKDLQNYRNMPIMIFIHYPLFPGGLYHIGDATLSPSLRKEMVDIFARRGNVRWVFTAHLHPTLTTSPKISWEYKGINFVQVPAAGFSEFYFSLEENPDASTTNGFLVVDVEEEKVRPSLWGLNGEVCLFPSPLNKFNPFQDPLWFSEFQKLPTTNSTVNSDFKKGLSGWFQPWIHPEDKTQKIEVRGENLCYLYCRGSGRKWQNMDKVVFIYQVIKSRKDKLPFLKANFYVEKIKGESGGFFKIFGYKENSRLEETGIICWWGKFYEGWEKRHILPDYLKIKLPFKLREWNKLSLDLTKVCKGEDFFPWTDGFLILMVGVWNTNKKGDEIGVYFERIELTFQGE